MKTFTFCAALLVPCALNGQVSTGTHASSGFELVITEIMADPDPSFGLPNAEYVELFNRSNVPVDLTGWHLYEGSNRQLPAIVLQPGEYLVVCANSDTLGFMPYGKVAGISSMSLTNGGEKISIRNPQGHAVDSVTYSDTWYGNSFKKDGGWSLERIDPHFTCFNKNNWSPSVSAVGGTPGTINSVNGIYEDHSSPVLLRAYCTDSTTVTLVFSEALDPSSINNLQNYFFADGINATHAAMANSVNTEVDVTVNVTLLKNKVYTIRVKQLTDCPGNLIEENSSAKFGLTDSTLSDGIQLNEILFNPFEGGYDFVEITNAGDNIIDVSLMKIASIDLVTNEPVKIESISGSPFLVFPGDYVVLTEKPEIVAAHYRSSHPFNFIAMSTLPSMNVDAGHVALLHGTTRLDEVRYHQDFHFQLLENLKGVSLEKINPKRNSMDPTSWHSASLSSGFATPGLINSQFTHMGNQTQTVSVFPEIFSPDHDGRDDVITFSIQPGVPGYIGNIVIYNAKGQIIYNNSKNNLLATSDAFTWDGIDNSESIAPPGIYVALVEIFNLDGDVKKYKIPFVLAIKF